MTDDPHANNLATRRPDANAVQSPVLSTPNARQAAPHMRQAVQLFPSDHPKLHAASPDHLEEQRANDPDLTKVTDQGAQQGGPSSNMPQGDIQ